MIFGLQAKNTMHAKLGQCEGCKKEYAAELQKTNQSQDTHYTTTMPAVFQVRVHYTATMPAVF